MTISNSQKTDAQTGQENFATQVKNKVSELGGKMQDLKDQAFKKQEPKPEEPKTAGEQFDAAVETTKTAVGDKMAQAGDALHDQSEAVAPKEDKSMMDKVKDGLSSLTGANKKHDDQPQTFGEKVDSKLDQGKQAVADNLDKAGDALQEAGDKTQNGEGK